jgi:phospholipid/cholesterol/gamma-HCH transport system substrate-binding protein
VTYHASLEQLLVLLPPSISSTQSYSSTSNPTGLPLGEFALSLADPPACSVGFLPPSSWRSPADTTTVDTPDGLYCKLPQDSPVVVRGARNYPCQGVPGKRAPVVQICESDKPYEPLAMRQHALGPYPMDPSLVSQGVPADDRVDFGDRIFAPTEGTPLPPGASPAGTPPGPTQPATSAPPEAPGSAESVPPPTAGPPPPDGAADLPPSFAATDGPPPPTDAQSGVLPAAPSSFEGGDSGPGPSVAVVQYDPRTGQYFGRDGRAYQQTNLAASAAPMTWKDLLAK